MADTFGGALLQRWARWARERAARTPPDGHPGEPDAPDGPEADTAPPLGTRLVGPTTPVARIVAVPEQTVALVREPGEPTVVRFPGELLLPRLLSPAAGLARATVISTAPVHLDLTVSDLVSLDGYRVDPVTLRLELQLDDRDGHTALVDRWEEHGDELEAVLLREVGREGAAAVRGAVAANRRADLERLGLARVLGDRWLPASFADRLLLQRAHAVGDGAAPDRDDDEPTVPVPVRAGPDPAGGFP